MCATNRPAELVVHNDKSHLHHDPALSPCHSPNMNVPVLTLSWQRHILVPFPLHQLWPCLATWNAPSKEQGIQRSVVCYHMPVTPWSNVQGTTLLSLPQLLLLIYVFYSAAVVLAAKCTHNENYSLPWLPWMWGRQDKRMNGGRSIDMGMYNLSPKVTQRPHFLTGKSIRQ